MVTIITLMLHGLHAMWLWYTFHWGVGSMFLPKLGSILFQPIGHDGSNTPWAHKMWFSFCLFCQILSLLQPSAVNNSTSLRPPNWRSPNYSIGITWISPGTTWTERQRTDSPQYSIPPLFQLQSHLNATTAEALGQNHPADISWHSCAKETIR